MELELRKAKRGGDGPAAEDYSGAGILVTRIQRECGLRMLNSQLKSTNRKRAAVGFGIWCVVTKGQLMSCPRGNSSGGSLIETVNDCLLLYRPIMIGYYLTRPHSLSVSLKHISLPEPCSKVGMCVSLTV